MDPACSHLAKARRCNTASCRRSGFCFVLYTGRVSLDFPLPEFPGDRPRGEGCGCVARSAGRLTPGTAPISSCRFNSHGMFLPNLYLLVTGAFGSALMACAVRFEGRCWVANGHYVFVAFLRSGPARHAVTLWPGSSARHWHLVSGSELELIVAGATAGRVRSGLFGVTGLVGLRRAPADLRARARRVSFGGSGGPQRGGRDAHCAFAARALLA